MNMQKGSYDVAKDANEDEDVKSSSAPAISFPDPIQPSSMDENKIKLRLSGIMMLWCLLILLFFWLLLSFRLFRWFFIVGAVVQGALTYFANGADTLEVKYFPSNRKPDQ